MSSYNEDDECDSSFMYRKRQAVKLDAQIIPIKQQIENENNLQKHEIYSDSDDDDDDYGEKRLEIDEEDIQPLDLSLKKYDDSSSQSNRVQISSTIYTTTTTKVNKTTHEVDNETVKVNNLKPTIKIESDLNEQEDSDNDLSELSWLINYNLKTNLKLKTFGTLSSESESDDALKYGDEADGGCHSHKSTLVSSNNVSLPASLLQNMLITHTKPPYSYSCLIFMAIESSMKKRLTVKEIYSWISTNFPYFRSIPSGSWKNSVRHNLSHNKCFKKIDKNLLACRDFSGKGSLWCVNSDCRVYLIDTLRRMPQRAYSMLQDVPESPLTTLNAYKVANTQIKSPKSLPKITSVTTKVLPGVYHRQTSHEMKQNELCNKKTSSNDSSNECSDFDAANALLMIKSATNESKLEQNQDLLGNTSRKRKRLFKITNKILKNAESAAKSTIESSSIKCNDKESTTPCPTDDHTYSNIILKKEQLQSPNESQPQTSKNKRKKGNKIKFNFKKIASKHEKEVAYESDNYESDNQSVTNVDTATNTGSTTVHSDNSNSSTDRISIVSADTLRNALLELSRAAELVEDKDDTSDESDNNNNMKATNSKSLQKKSQTTDAASSSNTRKSSRKRILKIKI